MKIPPIDHISYVLKHTFKEDLFFEHRFSNERKFRFDFAVPIFKLAIEYEGMIGSKSRHTSYTGYSKDCEKYNLAAIEGWTVLRYTALNFEQIGDDISKFLKLK